VPVLVPASSLSCSPPSAGCAWGRGVTNEGRQDRPSIGAQITVTPSRTPRRRGAEPAVGLEPRRRRSGLGTQEVLPPVDTQPGSCWRAARWAASRSPKPVPQIPVTRTAREAGGPGRLAAPSCRSLVLFLAWLPHCRGPGRGRGTRTR